MMNKVFYWCVQILELYAKKLGTTYEVINVWIFCIIEPIIFLVMLAVIAVQAKKLRTLKKAVVFTSSK